MGRRRHQAAEQQQLLQRRDIAVGFDQRDQAVAHGLQGGETHAGGDAEEQAVGLVPVNGTGEDIQRHHQLGALFDQADAEKLQDAQVLQCLVFKHPGDDEADDPADEKAGHDPAQRDLPVAQPLVCEGDESYRHQRRAQEDDGGEIVGIAGGLQRVIRRQEQAQSQDQDQKPLFAPETH